MESYLVMDNEEGGMATWKSEGPVIRSQALSGFMHCSSGFAPHRPQEAPSAVTRGLLLAQVPANSPSFFAQILIAIPANPIARSATAERMVSTVGDMVQI